MVRNTERRDDVICFGFFNGTVDELRCTSEAAGRSQLQAIAACVEAVAADGLYALVEEFTTIGCGRMSEGRVSATARPWRRFGRLVSCDGVR